MQTDTKFKDALPEATVARIRDILAAHGIDAVESALPSGVRHCHSMRLSVRNTAFGANGKGMTEAYSRASGYAEFMERLQAGYLRRRIWREQLLDFPDERQMTPDACAASCAAWLGALRTHSEAILGRSVSLGQVYRKVFEADGEAETVAALPFWEPATGEVAYFPKRAMAFLYNTNGLAAGNNLVEAAVQALSEVYERHNLLRMFFGSFTPPTIPDDYLRRVPKVWEIIESLRAEGLTVLVKDCSLGEPFPLVAAVVIDRPNHAYHVHLGAFPAFEIALERSFTEMFQGRSLQTVTDTASLAPADPKTRTNAELIRFLTTGCGRYPLSFFSEPPTYPFRPFPDRSGASNEALFRDFADYLAAKGCRLYLRDVSYLGFPSVRVVVPGMSEVMPTQLADRFPIAWMLERHRESVLRPMELDAEMRAELRSLLDYLAACYGPDAMDYLFLTGWDPDRGNRNVSRVLGRLLFAWAEWERSPRRAMELARSCFACMEPGETGEIACLSAFWEQLSGGADRGRVRAALSKLYGADLAARADGALEEGKNPFAQYLLRCDPAVCAACPYHPTCTGWPTDDLIEKVRAIVAANAAGAGTDALRECFERLVSHGIQLHP